MPMSPEDRGPSASGIYNRPYWTPQRRDLHAWLTREASVLVELYEAALEILFSDGFPAKVPLVCHAVREIRNRLPEIITGEPELGHFNAVDHLDPIIEEWRSAGLPLGGASSVSTGGEISSPDVPIPKPLFVRIAHLLESHQQGSDRNKKKASRLIEALTLKDKEAQEQLEPVVARWLNETKWFAKNVHHSGKPSSVAPAELLEKFELFEVSLGSLTRGFFKTKDEIDEILDQANS